MILLIMHPVRTAVLAVLGATVGAAIDSKNRSKPQKLSVGQFNPKIFRPQAYSEGWKVTYYRPPRSGEPLAPWESNPTPDYASEPWWPFYEDR